MASRIALITGAASGLGHATARRFVEQGGKVIIADLPSSNGQAVADQLNTLVGAEHAKFAPTDVTNTDHVQAAIDLADASWDAGINVAVNCAGICPAIKTLSKRGPHPLDKFEQTFQVNVFGTFNVSRLAAQRMSSHAPNSDGERGVIVQTASVSAFEGQIGQVAYASSKGAIASMTLPMARELASYGIRVNTIAPGLFGTPLLLALPEKVQTELASNIPFPKRLGNPEEFAKLVASIVDNPMMNGETIRLDGALRMDP